MRARTATWADYRSAISSPVYLRHPSSLAHETGPHPEGPGRIPAIEHALAERDWLGYRRVEAPAATDEQLERVHPPAYVAAVRDFSASGGGHFDADTVASAGSYAAALHAAGGACALVEELVDGGTRVGFCGMRPPGHHAEPARAMGFCLFNNVAIAARHALDGLGLERVLVVDWDVHHGNGTNEIFGDDPAVLFASLHQSPLYPGTGPVTDVGTGAGEGYSINLPLPPGSTGQEWLALVEHVVVPAARSFEPELVLVSAGFDAHREDPLASCLLETEDFAALALAVRRLADELDAPIGAVLEGGYDLDALAASVVATLAALVDGGPAPSAAPDSLTRAHAAVIGRHWPLTV